MANGRQIMQLLIPGGFRAGSEQTAAVQALLMQTGRAPRKKAKKKRAKKKATRRRSSSSTRKKTTRGRKKKAARLVKGSPAAKRHMAKLRAMQRKR